jgi:hypothetical protein
MNLLILILTTISSFTDKLVIFLSSRSSSLNKDLHFSNINSSTSNPIYSADIKYKINYNNSDKVTPVEYLDSKIYSNQHLHSFSKKDPTFFLDYPDAKTEYLLKRLNSVFLGLSTNEKSYSKKIKTLRKKFPDLYYTLLSFSQHMQAKNRPYKSNVFLKTNSTYSNTYPHDA